MYPRGRAHEVVYASFHQIKGFAIFKDSIMTVHIHALDNMLTTLGHYKGSIPVPFQ